MRGLKWYSSTLHVVFACCLRQIVFAKIVAMCVLHVFGGRDGALSIVAHMGQDLA